jgi:hypothetical protein
VPNSETGSESSLFRPLTQFRLPIEPTRIGTRSGEFVSELRDRSASYITVEGTNECMADYIVEEEQYLSPVVVGTTLVLIATFGIGLLYQLVGALS